MGRPELLGDRARQLGLGINTALPSSQDTVVRVEQDAGLPQRVADLGVLRSMGNGLFAQVNQDRLGELNRDGLIVRDGGAEIWEDDVLLERER